MLHFPGTKAIGVNPAGGGRPEVPAWSGEPEKLPACRLEACMHANADTVADRYVVGPQLVRALGPKVRVLAKSCPNMLAAGEVDKGGTLVGWDRVLAFMISNMGMTSLVGVGVQANDFFTKLRRQTGETVPDGCARFDQREADLLVQLKVLDNSAIEVLAKPLRTWWFLRKVAGDANHQGRDRGNGRRQSQLRSGLQSKYGPVPHRMRMLLQAHLCRTLRHGPQAHAVFLVCH